MEFIELQTSNKNGNINRIYSRHLKLQYEKPISSLLKECSLYRRFFVTITPTNPNRSFTPNDFISGLSEIYDDLMGVISTSKNRDRFPSALKPILLLALDTEGSRGNGRYQKYLLSGAASGPIPNLHAHGFLLLNPDTYVQLIIRQRSLFTRKSSTSPDYEIQYLPFDEDRSDRAVSYVTKSIETSELINIELSQMFLLHSKHRDFVTPEEITKLQASVSVNHKEHRDCKVHIPDDQKLSPIKNSIEPNDEAARAAGLFNFFNSRKAKKSKC